MIFEPVKPFLACSFQIKFATEEWEKRGAAAVRRKMFFAEQKIFEEDDRDEIDAYATPIVAISLFGVAAFEVVGTVRIHPDRQHSRDIWWGSRLAVARPYRKLGAVGAGLIRLAVSSAHGYGCREFFGNIQSQNAEIFDHMHWRTVSENETFGRPHHLMTPDLAYYPPFRTPEAGFLSLPKLAA
ncbi:hypothetical protein BH10PSE10_BH10PSE10_16630 [soil metagenome]